MSAPATIAYVFWHWVHDPAPARDYESRLEAFQESLLANAPPGYRRAAVFRHAPAPWLPDDACRYADWYLVDGGAALDALNEAAVSPACRAAHDAAARRAAGGTAGLYTLRGGVLRAGEIRIATWFSKPAGMGFEALDACVAECAQARPYELWRRRMVLGPTPEMCVLAAAPVELPEACAAIHVALEPLWPKTRAEDGGEGGEATR